MTLRVESLLESLESFRREDPAVLGVLLADPSGLPIATSFRERMDLMVVSAMATLIVRSAQTVFRNLSLRGDAWVVLESPEASILVRALRNGSSLIVLARARADLDRLRDRLEGVQEEVAQILAAT